MYTSLYILLSVLHYWLDAYPSYQSLKGQTGYRKAAMQSAWPEPWLKRFGKVQRVCFMWKPPISLCAAFCCS